MYTKGTVVTHRSRPDWGLGVVSVVGPEKCTVRFEHREPVLMMQGQLAQYLEAADRGTLAVDSPLLDEKRWGEVGPRPVKRATTKKRAASKKAVAADAGATLCEGCAKPLDRAQLREGETWKSCPSCSAANGKLHVFLPASEMAGTTDGRNTEEDPEGVQSWCGPCRRKEEDASANRRLCSDFDDGHARS